MATWYWGWGYDDWSGASGGDGGVVFGVGIYDWSGASASSGGGLPHRPSLRPVTEFATVLAAIDANEDGDHVHITETKHSRAQFPDGFDAVMSGSFGMRVTIRRRARHR